MHDNADIAIISSRFGTGIAPGKQPQNRAVGSPSLFTAQISGLKIRVQGTLDIGIQATAGEQRKEAHQNYGLLHHSISVDKN